ncbi:hypothetical protein Tco_1272169 [Tanacetum coccineum]
MFVSGTLRGSCGAVTKRDRENLLVVVREVEAECDAVEVKMKMGRGDHVVKKRKLIHPEEDTNMDELRVRIDLF